MKSRTPLRARKRSRRHYRQWFFVVNESTVGGGDWRMTSTTDDLSRFPGFEVVATVRALSRLGANMAFDKAGLLDWNDKSYRGLADRNLDLGYAPIEECAFL